MWLLMLDAAIDVTKEWLVDAAVRFENYSDFGSVFTGKLASRYKVAGNFNIRGSVSTGFRAPSLAQIHFSNTLTSFSSGAVGSVTCSTQYQCHYKGCGHS